MEILRCVAAGTNIQFFPHMNGDTIDRVWSNVYKKRKCRWPKKHAQ